MQDEGPPETSGLKRDEECVLPEAEFRTRHPVQKDEPSAAEALLSEPGLSGQPESFDAEHTGREPEPSESGEGASARAGGPKRSEELLLKNRKAQRRFRERQKSKITELEEKNAELTTELKRLQEEHHNIDSRMAALVRLVHQKNAQLDQLKAGQAAGALEDDTAMAFTDNLVLSWSEGQTYALTPDQVRGLTREDLLRIWKEYVQQLATNLGEFDTKSNRNAQQSALETIKRLTHELTMILLRVSICSPVVARTFAVYRLEEPASFEEDPEAMCRSIVSTMLLSSEQRSELVQLRQLFLAKQSAIMEQRSEVLAALCETQHVPPSAAGERVSSLQYLKAHEATNLLRQSLREEHALKLDFLSTVLKHLITPLQLSRCLVQSYPWFPDTLALTTWLAAEAGEPQAMAFFNPGTLSPRSTILPPPAINLPMASRGGSGFSTPRNTTPTTPPRTSAAIPSPFQVAGQPLSPGGTGSWGVSSHHLRTQHSGHSGLSVGGYGLSPAASPHYTPHGSPSPAPSPPLSPAHVLVPGLPKPQPPPQ